MLSKLLDERDALRKRLEEIKEQTLQLYKYNHEEISKEVTLWLKREKHLNVDISIYPNSSYGDVDNYYEMEIFFKNSKLLLTFNISKNGFQNVWETEITHGYSLMEWDDRIYHNINMQFKNNKCIKYWVELAGSRKLLPSVEPFILLLPEIISFIDRKRYLYSHYDVKSIKSSIYLLLRFYKLLPFPKEITIKILRMVL